MARKPEDVFRESVHRYKPKRVFQQKESNAFRGGIPDDYYESNGKPGTLRVEYKFTHKIPKELSLTNTTKPNLSGLQMEWLSRAYHNGQQVAVIVGTRAGGLILTDLQWLQPISREYFESNLKSRKEIMEWIEEQVTIDAYKRRIRRRAKAIEEANSRFKQASEDALSRMGNLCALVQDGQQAATD